uniref:Uncharacterized protein n=1 Tax=Caenorhabditis japonica TaxID=281687 RepID=A0A8R1ENS8_CAEJA
MDYFNHHFTGLEDLQKLHETNMVNREKEHLQEIKNLENEIKKMTSKIDDVNRKMQIQKKKERDELKVLKLMHKKEVDKIKQEICDLEEKYLAEIFGKMEVLNDVKHEMDSGNSNISNALKEEQRVVTITESIGKIDRLWLFVIEEMDPLFIAKMGEETGKDTIDLVKMALEDMIARKEEMNEQVRILIEQSKGFAASDKKRLYRILEEIGNPLESLEELKILAENGVIGDLEKLRIEMDEIGRWMDELRNWKLTPKKTVLAVMGKEKQAMLQ